MNHALDLTATSTAKLPRQKVVKTKKTTRCVVFSFLAPQAGLEPATL